MDKIEDKNLLRDYFRQKALAKKSDSSLAKKIVSHVLATLPRQSVVAGFIPKDFEPDIMGLYSEVGIDFVFPKVQGHHLEFYKPKSLQDLETSSFGIQEPIVSKSEFIRFNDIQVVLVPGVAFDRQFYRLGRGKGFYDRMLSQYKGLKIGVSYLEQISNEALPVENHDVRMDIIVTENFVMSRLDA